MAYNFTIEYSLDSDPTLLIPQDQTHLIAAVVDWAKSHFPGSNVTATLAPAPQGALPAGGIAFTTAGSLSIDANARHTSMNGPNSTSSYAIEVYETLDSVKLMEAVFEDRGYDYDAKMTVLDFKRARCEIPDCERAESGVPRESIDLELVRYFKDLMEFPPTSAYWDMSPHGWGCSITEDGLCITDGTPRDQFYSASQSCTFVVKQPMKISATYFDLEPTWDYVSIRHDDSGVVVETPYSGQEGPSGIQVPEGALVSFHSDDSFEETGFKICASAEEDDDGLSTGAVVGIAAGATAGVAIGGYAIYATFFVTAGSYTSSEEPQLFI